MAGNMAARSSWLIALKAMSAEALQTAPTHDWRRLVRQSVLSVTNLLVFSLLGATCLAFIEGKELEERGRIFFESTLIPLSAVYSRWLASLYIITTTVTTVGYGDIVPYTAGGKWFVMVSCTIGFVVDIVCILRVSELLNACMSSLAYKTFQRLGRLKTPGWFSPACLLLLLVSLAVSNAVFWMQLTRLNGEESGFLPWSFVDACWFSWATFTTVGFGDFSPANSGQLNLPLLLSYLLITLLGLAIMTSLIESMVEFVTDIRAAKQAAKLANKAIKKSKETVINLRRNSNTSMTSAEGVMYPAGGAKKPWRLPWTKSQTRDRDPLIGAPGQDSNSDMALAIDEKDTMAQLGADDIPTITVVDDPLGDGTDQNSSSSAESTDVEPIDTKKLNVW